jgi:catechol 2,3-dioxygenase-like lactoylglutathione lyase family enzyme
MNPRLSHTFLTVHDQDVALDFYTRVIGLQVTADVEFFGMRWLTVHSPTLPEVSIGLLTPPPHLPSEDRATLTELMAKGALNGVIFTVDDCDAAFAELRDAGAQVSQEPTDQEYGVRDFAIRDPSGNEVRFSEPVAMPA